MTQMNADLLAKVRDVLEVKTPKPALVVRF